MNKQALIKKVVSRLVSELEGFSKAARLAHSEATDEQSKAEHKYDTRGLEASYLAHGQVRQVMEMEIAIAAYEKLSPRGFNAGEPVDEGALVELEQDTKRFYYFIGPKAGGMEVKMKNQTVLVITPQSPLGEQLQGKKEGDTLEIVLAGNRSQYRVTKVE